MDFEIHHTFSITLFSKFSYKLNNKLSHRVISIFTNGIDEDYLRFPISYKPNNSKSALSVFDKIDSNQRNELVCFLKNRSWSLRDSFRIIYVISRSIIY